MLGVVVLLAAPWAVRAVVLADRWLIRRLLTGRPLSERVRELQASRAQAVDDTAALLRRVERDLHDGAQARLVAVAMQLGLAREKLAADGLDAGAGGGGTGAADPDRLDRVRELIDAAHRGAKEALTELRDLARGIHPPALDHGLAEALATLAARSAVPATLTADVPVRPTPAIETIAYFCAAELLANVAKHSGAGRAAIGVTADGAALRLSVTDDGAGGAAAAARRRPRRAGPAGRRGGRHAGRQQPGRRAHRRHRRPAAARMTGPRVVIAEDTAILREGLAQLLADRGFEVRATVGDGDALLAAVAEHRPDVTVVDVRMPPTFTDEGLRAAITLRREYPGTAVLMFSQYVETRYAARLLAGGAAGVGYLLKDRVADVAEFSSALARVAAGGTALDPEVVSQMVGTSPRAASVSGLTRREREVLSMMAEGRSNAAIAAGLVVSPGAVEKHVASIFAKLGLPPSESDNRRVLAVLHYLRSS